MKTISPLLLVIMMLGLSACGQQEPSQEASALGGSIDQATIKEVAAGPSISPYARTITIRISIPGENGEEIGYGYCPYNPDTGRLGTCDFTFY